MLGDGENQLSKSLDESSVEIEMTTNPAKASRVPLSKTRRTLSVVRRFLHRNSPGKLAVDKTKYKKLFQAVDSSHKDYVSTFSFMIFLKLNKLNTPENMEKTHHLVQFLTHEDKLLFDEFVTICEMLHVSSNAGLYKFS